MHLTIKNRLKIFLPISLGIMLVALLMTIFGYGVNLGIDFAGGLNIEYNMNGTFNQADVDAALQKQGLTDFKVSTTGEAGTTVNIRIPKLESEEEIQTLQTGLEADLLAKYPNLTTTPAELVKQQQLRDVGGDTQKAYTRAVTEIMAAQ